MSREAVPILLYHSVSERASRSFRPWAVRPSLFREHAAAIAASGRTAMTVDALAEAFAGVRTLPRRPVVITFDDGFADVHDVALPALRAHGLPATVFVTSGFVGSTSGWLAGAGEGDRPMMGWSGLDGLRAEGWEIGAHTVTHPQLDLLDAARSAAEIRGSRHTLEDRLGAAVTSFAYPHGYYTPRVRRQVAEAGFTAACAVRDALSAPGDDVLTLARVVVRDGMPAERLATVLLGEGMAVTPGSRPVRRAAWRLARAGRDRLRPAAARLVGPR